MGLEIGRLEIMGLEIVDYSISALQDFKGFGVTCDERSIYYP